MPAATPATRRPRFAWLPSSLATRVYLAYGLALVVGALFTAGMLAYQDFEQHIEENLQEVHKLADVTVHPIAESAVIGDFDTIKRVLASIVPASPLREAVYADVAGGVLDVQQQGVPEAPAWLAKLVAGRMPDQHRDISVGGRKYGDLYLRFSADRIASEVWSLVLKTAGLIFLGLAAGLALVRYTLQRSLRNLDRLQVYEAQVLAGSLDAEAALGEDAPLEIRNAIAVVNRTAGSLRAQYGQRIDFLMHSLIQHKKAMDEAAIVCELDAQGRLTHANDRFVAEVGLPLDRLLGRSLDEVGTEATGWQPSREIWHGEVAVRDALGGRRWHQRSIVPIFDAGGVVEKYICVDIDVSEQKASEAQLLDQIHRQNIITTFGRQALEGEELAELMQEAAEWIRRGLRVSHSAVVLAEAGELGHPVVAAGSGWQDGWIGREALRLVGSPATEATLALPGEMLQAHGVRSVLAMPADADPARGFTLVAASQDVRWFRDADKDFLRSLAHVLTAAIERHRSRERLTYLASFDRLTGLPNRGLLFERLEQALGAARVQGTRVCLLYLDLDRFKRVNDTLGHEAGDHLLVQAAGRMVGCLRASDTVARLAGDEFAILLPGLESPADAEMVARKVLTQLGRPFDLHGQEAFISASVGVAVYPDNGLDAETLVRCADRAMYHSKSAGRSEFRFYSEEMSAREADRLAFETELRAALERQEFFLLYQPRVDLSTGAISGFEALLRWRHPERGVVSPVDFIPVLEDTGLIIPVGEWVLRAVAEQVVRWRDQGLDVPSVAINLSARQFSSTELDDQVRAVLAETGVDPALLEFELTESMLMQDPDQAVEILRRFRSYGLRLSVDDFGTGYSSLSYLRRFPLDALKVDRAFVRDLATSPDDAAIALAIISLAHSLKLKVVAEGVETTEQLDMLTFSGCDEIQGFYFSRPVEPQACERMVREGLALAWQAAPDHEAHGRWRMPVAA